MLDLDLRRQARELAAKGRREVEIGRALRVSRTTVHRWLTSTPATDGQHLQRCFQCDARAMDEHVGPKR